MFETWGKSWQLVKESWGILQADKELLWFPVISGIITLIITGVMLIPSILVSLTLFGTGASEGVSEVVGFVGLFIFYLVTYTISIYFNTALIGAAMIRLGGGDPTMRDGFQMANSRIGNIVGFAAMSATVGVIIRLVQERGGMIGNIVAGLGGLAWNLATFLVIPVLVAQDIGPIDAVKRSAELLKSTWGEQITGNFSIGGIFLVLYLLLIIAGVGLAIAIGTATESVTLVVSIIVSVVVLMIALGIVQGALNGIYQAAVYKYASTGEPPEGFDFDLLRDSFKEKRKR